MAIDKQATWFAWQNPNWDGNVITTGGTSIGAGGTSAPSPNRTDAEVLAAKIQGRKDTDAYLQEQAAKQAYTDNFRNTQSHKWADYHYGEYLKQANDEQTNGRGSNSTLRSNYLADAVSRGNPVEQITAAELYDRNARSADYDKVQADIAAYKDYMNAADEAEGFKQKAIQNQYGDSAGVIAKAERDAADALKKAGEISDRLKRNYGITTNGLRVDTDAFNASYFDEALKSAKAAEASKPIDTIGMLTGTSMDYMDASTTDMLNSASEDDKLLYAYLLEQDKKNGTNIAPAFEVWLKDNQARARGAVRAEEIASKDEGLGKVLAYGTQAAGSGLNNALNSVRDSVTGQQGARSASEYAAEQLRQGLVEDGRKGAAFFFDAAQSIGAMTPGLVAGTINPALGAAVFGTTAGASGYQDKLDEGWTRSDAMSYGIATAIAEGGLQYVTGGISKLGNMAPAIKAAVDSIPKPVLRALAGAGVRGSAEFVEEFIQTYLDPAIVSVLQGTAYDTPEFREAFRNGALGFVSSLGLGGGEFINDLRNSQPTQSVDNAPQTSGNEITPPTAQNAEQTASDELNSQAMPSEARQIVAELASRGRVNNTTAAKIANSPTLLAEFSQMYSAELGGNPLTGTSHEVQTAIQNAVRQRAATQGKAQAEAQTAVDASAAALAEYSATETARANTLDAAANDMANWESAQNNYASYVRGVVRNGATAREAKAILDSPELKAMWESMSGRKLPDSRNKATQMIMQSRQNIGQDALLEAAGVIAPQAEPTAPSVSPSVQQPVNKPTPPSPTAVPTTLDVLATPTAPNAPSPATTAQQTVPTNPPADNGGVRERGFSANIATDEAMEQTIRDEFESDPEYYQQKRNADTLEKANKLFRQGLAKATQDVRDALADSRAGKKFPPEMVPLSRMVANQLAKNNDIAGAREILAGVAAELTEAGQLGQAARILRNADTTTKVDTIGKLVEKLNKSLSKGQRSKNIKAGMGTSKGGIVVSDTLLNDYANATSPEAQNKALQAIETEIASQIPATFADKFTAMRYLNMLGNMKTQVRNVGGNAIMAVTAATKRRVAGSIEGLVSAVTNNGTDRTSVLWAGGKLFKEAANDFDAFESEAMGEAKYSDTNAQISRSINEKRTIFNNKVLEGYRKLTDNTMKAGDRIFLRITYADAMSGWLKAHGVNSISEATPDQLDSAREFAIKEAQEATFRDSNVVSDYVSKFGRGKDTPKAVQIISEGIVPFRKTPANVAVRAVEYSPLGIVNTIIKSVQAKNGNANATDVINSIAKTATGTALFAAGIAASMAGKAKGSEDDEELAAFQNLRGESDYSIKIGDEWYSLSQFAPMAIPFFIGVRINEVLEEQGLNTESIGKILAAVSEPMLEMSMLGGVNDALSTLSDYGSGDGNELWTLFGNAALNYLTQGLSNQLLGQLESIGDKTRQTTYTDKDSFLGSNLQYKLGQFANKTPGWDYHQQDYVDAWGRTQSNGSDIERAYNALLNPTYSSEDRSTEVDAELERLYRDNKDIEGFKSVFPEKRSRSATYGDGKVMTPDEYLQFSKDSGQKKLELVSDFIGSEEYKQLDDIQRSEIINNLYNLADDMALKKIKDSNGVTSKSDWEDVAKLKNPAEFLVAKSILSDAKAGEENVNYDILDAMIGTYDPNTKALVGGTLDSDSIELLGGKGFNLNNLMFAATKNVGAEQWFTDHAAVNTAQKTLGDSDLTSAVAIMKSVDGDDASKLRALEAQLPPEKGGKRSATVRRFEAATNAGISFNDWATLEAAVKKADTNTSFDKKSLNAAMDNLHAQGILTGLNANTAYEIYKNHPNDETKVDVYDEAYGEANPKEEQDSGRYIDFIFGINN